MTNYDPVDPCSDCAKGDNCLQVVCSGYVKIDFDPTAIEQMEVEFEPCPVCDGSGITFNGIIYWRCFKCDGTGDIPKTKEG